ncbi:hypothetical protein ACFQ0K_04270 [Nocardioides caeni]|uniref:Uncharacterized protein n=1 Tax=Nocardioides caeni TaxID=574700 RepID=A0A4S8N560_9ACTN|nr:hypothetical protein [Nocardioides caeni]THV10731.1 hypothetical protein E9934_13400 [Nocardioides caeni]
MTPRLRITAAALALAATAVAGCSSGSEPSPPAGVDGLTIPTQDPDPGDFVDEVDEVDHPWLQWAPGTFREFEDGTILSVTVGPARDGIATVAVSRRARAEVEPAEVIDDFMAQDRDGNVWWLGRQEGVSGEVTWFDEPGLFLPATPRRGDGWVMATAPGLDVRAQIVDDGEDVVVPAGDFEDGIVLEIVENGVTRYETYVRGAGLVENDEAGLVTR